MKNTFDFCPPLRDDFMDIIYWCDHLSDDINETIIDDLIDEGETASNIVLNAFLWGEMRDIQPSLYEAARDLYSKVFVIEFEHDFLSDVNVLRKERWERMIGKVIGKPEFELSETLYQCFDKWDQINRDDFGFYLIYQDSCGIHRYEL